MNEPNYPIELWPNEPNRESTDREVRNTTIRQWKEDAKSKAGSCSFVIDAARIWNQLSPMIQNSMILNQAKTAVKKYCKELPTDK